MVTDVTPNFAYPLLSVSCKAGTVPLISIGYGYVFAGVTR